MSITATPATFIKTEELAALMTILIACLGTGKGAWTHLMQLIEKENWEKTFLVSNKFGMENFKCSKQVEFVFADENLYLLQLRDEIKKQLSGKIKDTEVALNLISGTGKEHMAVLGAC